MNLISIFCSYFVVVVVVLKILDVSPFWAMTLGSKNLLVANKHKKPG